MMSQLSTPRGRFPARGWHIALVAVALLGALSSHAPAAQTNYIGHYEMANAKAGRTFSLDVKQADSRFNVTFSAAMDDGSGAAPDGTGRGRVEDGVLSFTFKDSYDNEGTCTLRFARDGYHLSITVIKVVDPSPFHFYGNVLLKKTSDKPQ